jgi:hypothetical protein
MFRYALKPPPLVTVTWPALMIWAPNTESAVFAPTVRVLPLAICRLSTLPFAFSVTLLVVSRMQAFVEDVGTPLVQLEAVLQKLLPSLQVVEGLLKLPHWGRAGPAQKERESRRMRRKGTTQADVPEEERRRIGRCLAGPKTKLFMSPPERSRSKSRDGWGH